MRRNGICVLYQRPSTQSRLRPLAPGVLAPFALFVLAAGHLGCGESIWDARQWNVAASVAQDHLLVAATIADVHGDFIHMSIRRHGHTNGYTVEGSPAPEQQERDWSRVHKWFGELHPDTYLEGRIDDGSGEGPARFQTYSFRLPRGVNVPRQSFADEDGSDYEYITEGYAYADGNHRHPAFDAGNYEIVIYAWYTGSASRRHPATDDSDGVQYIHYKRPLTSSIFVIE